MNAVASKCFPCLLEFWRDEGCNSPAEGAIVACATAAAVMLLFAGLKSELHQMLDLVSRIVESFHL